MSEALTLLDNAAAVRMALSPIRRRLLALLREPGSATSLAAAMDMPRQKIGYHLRALEAAGLVTEVETRKRRGFTERLLAASSDAYVIDPDVLSGPSSQAARTQDRYAADHLVRTAAETVRDVGRMRQAAEAEGRRLLTFTLDAEIAFAAPCDIERFAERLAGALSELTAEFNTEGGRPYRLIAAAHPAAGARRPKPLPQ
ncbi:MAG: helix-turn-helix domain-containing protein [Caulobacter sp.]|nr:helix-turn-helix domain-containing protein [Caulobacter sp.]